MEHPDEEVLTQFALDDPLALDAATLVHISDCDRCTHEIQEIQRVVDAALASGGRADLRALVEPPPEVWERVLVEVGARGAVADDDLAAAPSGGAAGQPPPAPVAEAVVDEPVFVAPESMADAGPIWLFDQPGEIETTELRQGDRSSRPGDRRAVWQVAVAGLVGLVLGAGVAWLVADNGSSPTISGEATTSALTGVDGNSTSGEISLVQRDGGAPELTVNIDSLDRGPGYLEAWLLNPDDGGLVPLGVIDGTEGTFTVPPSLNLEKYSQVDVSREPFDGDPAHSGLSLARGPVPTS
jgi:hypothetical protein